MDEFQAAAQAALGSDPAKGVLAHFGLASGEVILLAVMAYFTTALVKKHTTLPGWAYLVTSALASGLWAALWYVVSIPKPVAAAVMVFLTASGGWQAFKDVVGKFQFGGTNPNGIKPAGEFNRGPSVNPGGNP